MAVNLGIDFGSTGIRVAYAAPGDVVRFVTKTDAGGPWLLCEPGAGGSLPVSFPSLKSRLGVATTVETGGKHDNPGDVLARELDAVRGRIVAETSASVGQTVISVPARFSATQRTALIEAAGRAGLRDVSLITDSVAAVIAQTDGTTTGTFLVYAMGYDGFELALIRAVRGRYRVLGYEGAAAPGGRTFDAHVLGGWLELLRQHGAKPDEVRHGDAGWLRLRMISEKVKERLAAGGPVVFPMFAPGPDNEQQLIVQFDQPAFDRMIRSLTAGTRDRLTALFEQSGLAGRTADTVLLVGGSTAMSHLREPVTGLGDLLTSATDEHVARGAVLHAHQLGRRSSPAFEEPPATTSTEPAAVVHASPLAATLLTAPGGTMPTEPDGPATVDRARRLVGSGRVDEARAVLRRLMAEAQGVLDELDAAPPADVDDRPTLEPTGTTGTTGTASAASAAELIAAARKRVGRNNPGQAIALAHLAWRQEPHNPEVFEAMLDLHCKAAMASPTIRNFDRDENWLRCALRHDPSNARIRRLLAERIYLHGRELNRTGKKDEARKVLQHALTWEPEHKAAEQLLHQFGGRR